nr:uncharacterized protein LOC116276617 [Vicugna pacos]
MKDGTIASTFQMRKPREADLAQGVGMGWEGTPRDLRGVGGGPVGRAFLTPDACRKKPEGERARRAGERDTLYLRAAVARAQLAWGARRYFYIVGLFFWKRVPSRRLSRAPALRGSGAGSGGGSVLSAQPPPFLPLLLPPCCCHFSSTSSLPLRAELRDLGLGLGLRGILGSQGRCSGLSAGVCFRTCRPPRVFEDTVLLVVASALTCVFFHLMVIPAPSWREEGGPASQGSQGAWAAPGSPDPRDPGGSVCVLQSAVSNPFGMTAQDSRNGNSVHSSNHVALCLLELTESSKTHCEVGIVVIPHFTDEETEEQRG